jgi:hypothetical protein
MEASVDKQEFLAVKELQLHVNSLSLGKDGGQVNITIRMAGCGI